MQSLSFKITIWIVSACTLIGAVFGYFFTKSQENTRIDVQCVVVRNTTVQNTKCQLICVLRLLGSACPTGARTNRFCQMGLFSADAADAPGRGPP